MAILGLLSGVFGVRAGPDGLIMILTFISTQFQLEPFILEPFRVHVYGSHDCHVPLILRMIYESVPNVAAEVTESRISRPDRKDVR